MSKIAVIVTSEQISASALSAVKAVTGLGIRNIKAAVREGRPICSAVLFMNDHDRVARQLVALLSVLEDNALKFTLYELADDEEIGETAESYIASRIDPQTLTNILASFEQERTRQSR